MIYDDVLCGLVHRVTFFLLACWLGVSPWSVWFGVYLVEVSPGSLTVWLVVC